MIDRRYFKNKHLNTQLSIETVIPDTDEEFIIEKSNE